jgi:hypothetical protein
MDGTIGNPRGHVCVALTVSTMNLKLYSKTSPQAPSRARYAIVPINNQYMLAGLHVLG